MIPVTKPFLPLQASYEAYISQIWENNWLTNHGPLNNQLEEELSEYLKLKRLLIVNNGTIALQIAMKALDLKGEIITTPFSFIATTSSILWEGLTPVFADIDGNTFNIDPTKIEEKITNKTTAILTTHVFGNPCDNDAIGNIAKKHHLKVIYDAAQAFGTRYQNKSIFTYGDISTASFHATKLFHTTEGGAVFSKEENLLAKMQKLSNFGFSGVNNHSEIGINGKNSEFHAAMGLCVLNKFDEISKTRKKQYEYYYKKLQSLNLVFQQIEKDTNYNYSYFPIVFESDSDCTKVEMILNEHDIYPRRYFNPSLNKLSFVEYQSCPVSESLVGRILCLPLYHDLSYEQIDLICELIIENL